MALADDVNLFLERQKYQIFNIFLPFKENISLCYVYRLRLQRKHPMLSFILFFGYKMKITKFEFKSVTFSSGTIPKDCVLKL